ncbi:MAG: hypothetical protein EXR59_01990 [Dehalococcoidia bacterium]|nr:hypothetical protein [Dehalococcoidia bacterium]
MHIQILGAHNLESLQTRLTCMLLDNVIAFDAGALTSTLTLPQQKLIKHLLITHKHFDHVRDLLTLGINTRKEGMSMIYSIEEVLKPIKEHYLDGKLYPDFTKVPDVAPKFNLVEVSHDEPFEVGDYEVTPIKVKHGVPAVGFLVKGDKKSFFYSGDCGGEIARSLHDERIDVLFTEVTFSDESMDEAIRRGHMTPAILAGQLLELDPKPEKIVVLHMDPTQQVKIKQEISIFADTTGMDISLGREGQIIEI